MSIRPHERAPKTHLAARFVGVATTILLAWQTVTTCLPLSYARTGSDARAADAASQSPAAATIAAQQRLTDNDPAGAALFARKAVAGAPISIAAVRTLALSEQQLGHQQLTNALMAQAATLGWRDTPTQIWLASAEMEMQDYAAVANRLDAALRVNRPPQDFFPTIDFATTTPGLLRQLTARLALSPPWRSAYFRDGAPIPAEALQARGALLFSLISSQAPPTRDELVAMSNKLAAADQFDQARDLWFAGNKTPNAAIYDPAFLQTRSTGAAPFEWALRSIPGAEAIAEDKPDIAGRALHVTTDGATMGVLAQQWLRLKPGAYRFGIKTAGTPSALSAFSWTVLCADAATPLVTVPANSARESADFLIPDSACDRQLLQLHVQGANSEAWFWRPSLH